MNKIKIISKTISYMSTFVKKVGQLFYSILHKSFACIYFYIQAENK